jgi:hypothetical protein
MKKLGNKGSIWAWPASLAIIFTTLIVWYTMKPLITKTLPQALSGLSHTTNWAIDLLPNTFDAVCVIMILGSLLWAFTSSTNPEQGLI